MKNLVMLIMFLAAVPAVRPQSFEAAHFEQTVMLHLSGTTEDVFRMFEPVQRSQWNKRWQFEYVYPPSGQGRAGALTIQRISHGGESVKQVWLLSEYKPFQYLKYVVFVPEMESWEMEIEIIPAHQKTDVRIKHRVTALSELANGPVESFRQNLAKVARAWETKINELLEKNNK